MTGREGSVIVQHDVDAALLGVVTSAPTQPMTGPGFTRFFEGDQRIYAPAPASSARLRTHVNQPPEPARTLLLPEARAGQALSIQRTFALAAFFNGVVLVALILGSVMLRG
jgi:hypothetical protein